MKTVKKLTALVALASLTLASGAALADPDCSVGTLSGTYVFSATGWGAPGGTWAPKAIVEVIQFNADGTLVAPSATVANRAGDGQILSTANSAGHYTLKPECTGTLNFTDGPSFNIVAAPKGDELWMIQTNPNNVFQGHVTRISH